MARPKKQKMVDQNLPTMQEPRNEAIEAKAASYVTNRDERMRFGKLEVGDKQDLKALMQSENLTTYKSDVGTVTLEVGETDVKVKTIKIKVDDEDGNPGEE